MITLSERLNKICPEVRNYFLQVPVHYVTAQRWKRVERMLTDFEFIEEKCCAEGLFDLLRDYDRATEAHDLAAVAQVQRVLAQAMSSLSERPTLALQIIYNRLIWFEHLDPILQSSLDVSHSLLNQKQFWVSAEAPLPGSHTKGTTSVPFTIESSIQSFSPASMSIGIASAYGKVEVRNMPDGFLLNERSLNASRIVAIALLDKPARLAYMDIDGVIRSDQGDTTLTGRRGEVFLAYHASRGVIAMRSDNALVAWRADQDEADLLAADLPAPLIVLKTSADGNNVLFVAGFRDQKIGLSTWTGERWVTKMLSYAGPRLIDADLDSEAAHVLLASLDRRLSIMKTEDGEMLQPELFYEAREDAVLRGAPIKCALGVGKSTGWTFIATEKGHIACWNWRNDQLERLEDYQSINQSANLIHFRTIQSSGELLLTTETKARTMTTDSHYNRAVGHFGAVSSCCITASGQVVSAGEGDQTIRWFSADGLKPLAQQVRDHWEPSVVSPYEDTDHVIVGTRLGLVWSQPPHGEVAEKEVFITFAEPVVSVFSAGNGSVLAAGQSGRVLRIHLLKDKVDRLRHSTGTQKQRKILPAGNHGIYYSFYEEDSAGQGKHVLSLVTGINQEQVILTSNEHMSDVAVSSDGATICTAGGSVQILRQIQGGWSVIYSRNIKATRVAFLGEKEDMIVVALDQEDWLEVWSIADGLPTVAAIELNAKLSCLYARKDLIIAGFRSGILMAARLRSGVSLL